MTISSWKKVFHGSNYEFITNLLSALNRTVKQPSSAFDWGYIKETPNTIGIYFKHENIDKLEPHITFVKETNSWHWTISVYDENLDRRVNRKIICQLQWDGNKVYLNKAILAFKPYAELADWFSWNEEGEIYNIALAEFNKNRNIIENLFNEAIIQLKIVSPIIRPPQAVVKSNAAEQISKNKIKNDTSKSESISLHDTKPSKSLANSNNSSNKKKNITNSKNKELDEEALLEAYAKEGEAKVESNKKKSSINTNKEFREAQDYFKKNPNAGPSWKIQICSSFNLDEIINVAIQFRDLNNNTQIEKAREFAALLNNQITRIYNCTGKVARICDYSNKFLSEFDIGKIINNINNFQVAIIRIISVLPIQLKNQIEVVTNNNRPNIHFSYSNKVQIISEIIIQLMGYNNKLVEISRQLLQDPFDSSKFVTNMSLAYIKFFTQEITQYELLFKTGEIDSFNSLSQIDSFLDGIMLLNNNANKNSYDLNLRILINTSLANDFNRINNLMIDVLEQEIVHEKIGEGLLKFFNKDIYELLDRIFDKLDKIREKCLDFKLPANIEKNVPDNKKSDLQIAFEKADICAIREIIIGTNYATINMGNWMLGVCYINVIDKNLEFKEFKSNFKAMKNREMLTDSNDDGNINSKKSRHFS